MDLMVDGSGGEGAVKIDRVAAAGESSAWGRRAIGQRG